MRSASEFVVGGKKLLEALESRSREIFGEFRVFRRQARLEPRDYG